MLSGVVGSVEDPTRLFDAAAVRSGGHTVVDQLTVTAGPPATG